MGGDELLGTYGVRERDILSLLLYPLFAIETCALSMCPPFGHRYHAGVLNSALVVHLVGLKNSGRKREISVIS